MRQFGLHCPQRFQRAAGADRHPGQKLLDLDRALLAGRFAEILANLIEFRIQRPVAGVDILEESGHRRAGGCIGHRTGIGDRLRGDNRHRVLLFKGGGDRGIALAAALQRVDRADYLGCLGGKADRTSHPDCRNEEEPGIAIGEHGLRVQIGLFAQLGKGHYIHVPGSCAALPPL